MSAPLRLKAIAAAAVVVGLVAAAAWVTTRDRTATLSTTPLLPGFAAQIASVQRVRLYTAGNTLAVDLVRSGDEWSVTERNGYRADPGRIGVLLQDLAELEGLEPKTATPGNYPALGVEDLAEPGAQGVRIEVVAAAEGDAAPRVDLIVGKADPGMNGTYVRLAGDAQSWLVNRLEVPADPARWLASLVIHVDTDRIQEAVVRRGAQGRITLAKPDRSTRNFSASGLPRGRALARPDAANGIATALIAIENEDVRRADTLPARRPDADATFRTFDGLVVTASGWILDGEHWITLQAAFDAALADRFADDRPADSTGIGFYRTPEQVQQEVARLQTRLPGWAFRIPTYKYDALFPEGERWMAE